MATTQVLSIARPLIDELTDHPFSGRVMGRFERACNLIDEQERVIALTLPEIGNGPFSIVVAGNPGLFNQLSVGERAWANQYSVRVGGWHLNLRSVKVWEPKLVCFNQPPKISPAIANIIKPYVTWPSLNEINAFSAGHLAKAAAQLKQALVESKRYKRVENVMGAVGQLAGLGSGLTPAGDDYLVGVMAALWLTGHREMLPKMGEAASSKTTALSAAFLRAAAQGEFIEAWHTLGHALGAGEAEALSQAAKRMAEFGASSGQDALAGFATTLLNHVDVATLPSILL